MELGRCYVWNRRRILAIGVEKIYQPNNPEKVQEIYDGGIDQFDRNEWLEFYESIGMNLGNRLTLEIKKGQFLWIFMVFRHCGI